MLHLADVTLVVIDTAYKKLTEMAVADTLCRVSFDDILVFADQPLDVPAKTIPCQLASNKDAEQFMWYGVYPHLRTNFALFIQWDGWVTSPELWRDEFRQFDWIGARWHFHPPGKRVGNGGFSLRSRKLLNVLYTERARFPYAPPEGETLCFEDKLVCLNYSDRLTADYNIKFADEDTASVFSTEYDSDPHSFGFHGIWNWVDRLSVQECITRFNLFTEAHLSKANIYLLLNKVRLRPELQPALEEVFRRYNCSITWSE